MNCTPPNIPRNGFLDEVTSTTIMFGCNEGYSPQGTMTAECVATDTWSPDPAQLECTITNGMSAEMDLFTITVHLILFMYWCIMYKKIYILFT